MSEEDKKRVKLVRMPDGSMRPATDTDSDIGSIYLTQQQIRANEAKQEQLLKAQGKKRVSKRQLKKLQKKQATSAVVAPKSAPANTLVAS